MSDESIWNTFIEAGEHKPITNGDESFYAIRRVDGHLMGGAYTFEGADGPHDWQEAEADGDDSSEPIEYELVRMRVETIARKWFGGPTLEVDDD
jgi:hypothetical protein